MGKVGGCAAALAVALAACAEGPAGPSVRFSLPSTGLPKPLEVPWPSDLYRSDADGTIADGLSWKALKLDGAEAAFEAYGALDGFGRHAGAIFLADGLGVMDEIDPDTVVCGTTVALVDPAAGKLPCLAGYDPLVRAIGVAPRDTLQPGKRYAAVVTRGVKLKDGRALAAAPEMARIRDGSRAGAAGKLYGDAVDDVARAAGIAKSDMVAVTAFTTQTTHGKLKKIRDALEAGKYGAAPSLITSNPAAPYRVLRFGASAHTDWTATLDEWLGAPRKGSDGKDLPGLPNQGDAMTTGIPHDAVGAVLQAAFVSPELRRPFMSTGARDDGTIAYDSNGDAVVVKADQQVPLTLVVPKGPVPASGFPVVIFQHGIGGDRSVAAAIANELARAGIATASIDAPVHGMRSKTATDEKSNGRGSYQGPDGMPDAESAALTVLAMIAELRNPLAWRDNFWQATIDLVQLRRLLANSDLTLLAAEYGGNAPKLDATHVGYIGMSMGGVLGAMMAAVEPKSAIDPFVLDVPGAALMRIFTESAGFNSQLVLLAAAGNLPLEAFDGGVASAWINLAQGIFDGGDPGSFGAEAAAEHNIWMVGGMHDEVAPRSYNDVLARALGATQMMPTLRPVEGLTQSASPLMPGASGRVAGYYELAPASHFHLLARTAVVDYEPPVPRAETPRFPKLPQRIIFREAIVGMHRAAIDFFKATWAGAPKIVVDAALHPAILPVADLDDDGFCDEDERAAGSDPYKRASTPASGTANCVRAVGFDFP